MLRALLALLVLSAAFSAGQRASVYPPPVKSDEIPSLLEATKHVRLMEESALLSLVPTQSGIFFVDCPNCESGRQEGQLAWDPARPEEVTCRYCSHAYPSRKYLDEKAVIVKNPRGEEQRYPYWENSSG